MKENLAALLGGGGRGRLKTVKTVVKERSNEKERKRMKSE
jgi:hypothetical protein